MLQIIHEKVKGIVATVIIGLIALAFVFTGINEFLFSKNSRAAATVGDKAISWQSVLAIAERVAREQGVQSRNVAAIRDVQAYLVQQEALYQGFYQQGFRISEHQIAKRLASVPQFQDVDGKFSKEKYHNAIYNAGYREPDFRLEVGHGLILAQAEQGVMRSAMALPYQWQQTLSLLEETRDIGYVTLPKSSYMAKVKPSTEQLRAYFDSYASRYILPEQVSLDYVELTLDRVTQDIQYTEAELENFYKENQGFYNTPDMRHVRQILFHTEGLDAQGQAKQKARAEKTLEALKAGDSFENLAKSESDDEQTRELGGDMGWITPGELDYPLEKAVFALNTPKAISPLIQTPYGYHIFQLEEQKLATTQSFKEARTSIIEQYQKQKAQQLFEEKKEQLATLAFESPESLESIQRVMGLQVYTTALFDREGHGAEKWTEYPEFMKAAFSPSVMTERKNSGLVHLTPEKVVVLHLRVHQPAQQAVFEAITDRVKADYVDQEAKLLLKSAAIELQDALKKGQDPAAILKPLRLSWRLKSGVSRHEDKLDRGLVEKTFEFPGQRLGEDDTERQVTYTELPSGDYLVIQCLAIHPGDPSKLDPKLQMTYHRQLNESLGQLEFALWSKQVTNKIAIKVSPLPKAWESGSIVD